MDVIEVSFASQLGLHNVKLIHCDFDISIIFENYNNNSLILVPKFLLALLPFLYSFLKLLLIVVDAINDPSIAFPSPSNPNFLFFVILFGFFPQFIQSLFERFNLFVILLCSAAFFVSMTGNNLTFSKPLFKYSFDLFLGHYCPNLGVHTSDKNGVFGNKFFNKLLG